jgi:hypothetical protein
VEAAVSEDEWARQRKAFDDEDGETTEGLAYAQEVQQGKSQALDVGLMSPEEADGEAKRLDEAMVQRHKGRI